MHIYKDVHYVANVHQKDTDSVPKPEEKKAIDEMISPQGYRKPTLSELERVLRNKTGTTEEFYELIHQKSDLDRAETAEFVAKLIDEGKLAYDPEGWLVWVR